MLFLGKVVVSGHVSLPQKRHSLQHDLSNSYQSHSPEEVDVLYHSGTSLGAQRIHFATKNTHRRKALLEATLCAPCPKLWQSGKRAQMPSQARYTKHTIWQEEKTKLPDTPALRRTSSWDVTSTRRLTSLWGVSCGLHPQIFMMHRWT